MFVHIKPKSCQILINMHGKRVENELDEAYLSSKSLSHIDLIMKWCQSSIPWPSTIYEMLRLILKNFNKILNIHIHTILTNADSTVDNTWITNCAICKCDIIPGKNEINNNIESLNIETSSGHIYQIMCMRKIMTYNGNKFIYLTIERWIRAIFCILCLAKNVKCGWLWGDLQKGVAWCMSTKILNWK